ncbi:hypothetical protein VTI28DRAFT_3118 [Corynascus sepedonium]
MPAADSSEGFPNVLRGIGSWTECVPDAVTVHNETTGGFDTTLAALLSANGTMGSAEESAHHGHGLSVSPPLDIAGRSLPAVATGAVSTKCCAPRVADNK